MASTRYDAIGNLVFGVIRLELIPCDRVNRTSYKKYVV